MERRPQLGLGIFIYLVGIFGLVAECEARRVKVAHPGYDQTAALTIARDKGYYREEDLEVEIILMSAPVVSLALIGGDVDFAAIGGAGLSPILRGAPLRILFTTFYRPLYSLYGKQDIHELTGLKGKRVGVSGIGSAPDLLLRELFKRHGLESGRDVTILGLGLDRYAALVRGAVDAAILSAPATFRAEEGGFRELVSFIKEDLVEFPLNIVVREERLQTDVTLIEKFLRATIKGFRYTRDNRSGTISNLARYTGVKEDFAAKTYDMYWPAMTRDGTVSEELQRRAVEQQLKIIGLKESPPMEKIFDFSLTRRIRAELDTKGWRPGP